MPTIDLLTGFLGSGKTTFMKEYAKYLTAHGARIGLLENDHGAVNVDMMLLRDLQGDHCGLEMIAGGCDEDCYRRRFKTKLITLGMYGYDRVVMEPSGIFDADDFFDVLSEEPLDQWFTIGSVITIVDAGLEEELSDQAEYLLACQLIKAGIIVFSRVQENSPETIEATMAHLDRIIARFSTVRYSVRNKIIAKDWAEFTIEDFEKIMHAGYDQVHYVKHLFDSEGFTTYYYMNLNLTAQEIRSKVDMLMHDPAYGGIFRIKGFMKNEAGEYLELNATRRQITCRPIDAGQNVIVVIGENMNRALIDGVLETKSI